MSYSAAAMDKARRASAINYAGNWGPRPLTSKELAMDVDLSNLIATLARGRLAADDGNGSGSGSSDPARRLKPEAPRYNLQESKVFTSGWTEAGGGNDQRGFARFDSPILLDRIEVQYTVNAASDTMTQMRLWRVPEYMADPSAAVVDPAGGYVQLTEPDYYNFVGDIKFSNQTTAEQYRLLLFNKFLTDPQTTLVWDLDNGSANVCRWAVTTVARRLSGDPSPVVEIPQPLLVYRQYTTPRPSAPRPAAGSGYPKAVRVSITQGGRILSSRIIPWEVLDPAVKVQVITNAANGITDPRAEPIF